MKTILFLFLIFPLVAFAHDDPDVLQVNTQFGTTTYVGDITQLDLEDSIAQVEINDATIDFEPGDKIFANGFELYNVNWIWVGDDTADNEFGGAGDCSYTYRVDPSNHATYVVLYCYQIQNESARAP